MSAARAFIEMSAEHGSAIPRNGQQHFDMLPGDPLTRSKHIKRQAGDAGQSRKVLVQSKECSAML